jgi:hypothetical protein
VPEQNQKIPSDSWLPSLKRIAVVAIERSGITSKGKELLEEIELIVKKAPICLTVVICFVVYSFIDGCRKSSEIGRLARNNESQARVIEINSATSQSTQMQMQGLNHKILDLEHEVDGVKRERDRIEDWVLNRSTNTLPAFFTYSGTNTVTVTNYLPSAVLQNRVLSPEVVQAVKFTLGLQTNKNDRIAIVSTKGDKESYALAGQIKKNFGFGI